MAIVARDIYELVVQGVEEGARQLAAMNARLDETRRRAFEAGQAFDNLEDIIKRGTKTIGGVAGATLSTDQAIVILLRHLEEERRRFAEVQGAAQGAAGATRNAGQAVVVASEGFSKGAASLLSLDAASNLLIKSWGLLRRAGEALAAPLGLAASFETEIAAIDTISRDAGTKFQAQFLDISRRLGIDAAQVARAGYEAVGSGVAEAILPQFTEIAGKLSIAGRAEIQPTLSLLTTLQNQFSLSVEGVAQASDILFATTKVGVTTIQQLATELGGIVPTARAAGFDIQKLGAGIAALTKLGNSTSESATQLRSLAVSLSTDMPKLMGAFEDVGVSMTEADFKALSLKDQMVLLSNTFDKNQGPLIKAFGRIEGVSAALALGRDNGRFFQEALDEIGKSAGATDAALAIMQETTGQTAARLKAEFNAQLILLGNQLLPQVNAVMVELTEYLKANGPELAESIKGGVDQLVSLGRWVADHGTLVITFFGVLAGGKIALGITNLGLQIAGVGKVLTGATVAATALRGALAFLTGPIGLVVTGITAIIATVDALIDKLSEVELGKPLSSFANSVDLSIRAANAEIERTRDRRRLTSGDGVLVDPGALNQITGEVGVGLNIKVASLQETLNQGINVAADLIQRNIDAMAAAAATQRSREETAIANLEGVLADREANEAEIARLSEEQARGNVLISQRLVLAINRRAQIEADIANLEGQALDARQKAAGLELSRARLFANFQESVLSQLGGEFKGIGQRLLSGLNAGALARQQAPKKPGRGGGSRDNGIDDELRFDEEAQQAGIKLREAALRADFVNAERRTSLIADSNERDLRLLALRHGQEFIQAQEAGENLGLLLQKQGQERAALIQRQEETAAQIRAQAQQDYITGLTASQSIAQRLLEARGQADEAAVFALRSRQEQELLAFKGTREEQLALQEIFGREMQSLIEQQNRARVDSYLQAGQDIAGIFSGLVGVVKEFGLESNVLTGLSIVAEGIYLQAKAITYGIRAGAAALDLDPRAFGFAALALQAQAGAIKQFALASQLGAPAPGGAGGARGAGGAAPRRNPRLEQSGGRDDKRATITYVFNGDVYDTDRAARAALAARTLRGFRALEDAPRGAPRARISEFES